MSRLIQITIKDVNLIARLNNTYSSRSLYQRLPLDFLPDYWGNSLYGSIARCFPEEDPVDNILEAGTLAYWPPGGSLFIFWGETPVSSPGRIIPPAPVNLLGKVTEGLDDLIQKRPVATKCYVRRVNS